MSERCEDVFGCIESAQDFLALLTEEISLTRQDVHADLENEAGNNGSRKKEALRIALYDLELLEYHLIKSKRLANDLRMVRRLLLKEVGVPEDQLPAVQVLTPPVRIEMPVPPRQTPREPRRPRSRRVREDLVQVAAA